MFSELKIMYFGNDYMPLDVVGLKVKKIEPITQAMPS
jgi:hypothetical protein